MGTTLTGTTPQDTYDSLIKVTDNGPISGTLKALSDGLGNDSTLSLSTTAASIAGTLAVTGNATFDTNTLFVDAAANRVGVGLTAPKNPLHVNTSLQVGFVDASNDAMVFTWGGASTNGTIQTFSSSALALNPAGNNVGIGTATPKGKLDLIHGDTSPVGLQDVSIDALRIGRSGGGVTAIRSAQYDSVGQPAAGDIQFLNLFFNGSTYNYYERMRVTAAGNVGIGTSAPTAKLHVYNAADSSINVNTAATGTFPIKSGISFGAASTALGGDSKYTGGAGIQGLNIQQADNVTDLIFWTTAGGSPSEKVRITSAGVVELTQGQIKFPATQVASANANTLDDYEEGTWTMGISFGGASVGVTYGVNTGTYTKIGRQVTANGLMTLSSKGSSTGAAFITGLPFTIASGNSNYAAVSLRFDSITFTNQFQAYGGVTSTNIELEEITLLGAVSALTNADFANACSIMVSATYFV